MVQQIGHALHDHRRDGPRQSLAQGVVPPARTLTRSLETAVAQLACQRDGRRDALPHDRPLPPMFCLATISVEGAPCPVLLRDGTYVPLTDAVPELVPDGGSGGLFTVLQEWDQAFAALSEAAARVEGRRLDPGIEWLAPILTCPRATTPGSTARTARSRAASAPEMIRCGDCVGGRGAGSTTAAANSSPR
jgi:hypothetical protein